MQAPRGWRPSTRTGALREDRADAHRLRLSYAYDGADRLVARGSDSFAYDPLGRLTSSTVAGPLPATRTYAYDGDGLLRSRTQGAATTGFLWDASIAPAPLVQAGGDRVVHGLGPLYLARADGTTLTLVRDALGSVRAEVNDQGVITKAFRYAAYGEVAQASPLGATPTLLGFAGELTDPSGLIYLRPAGTTQGPDDYDSRELFRALNKSAATFRTGRFPPVEDSSQERTPPSAPGSDGQKWAVEPGLFRLGRA